MMPRMRVGGSASPSRRALLVGALGALPALGGCGIRLEDDAPRVPLVPTREPLPGEALLTALTRECAHLADLAGTATGDLATDLAPLHRRQHTVLRTTLVRLGVPAAVVDAPVPAGTGTPSAPPSGAATTSGSPSSSVSASATPSSSPEEVLALLGTEEGRSASLATRFTTVEAELHVTVAALHAQRFAAAVLLTGSEPEVPPEPVEAEVVEELAARTAGAVYLLEVVAARTGGRTRKRARATLGSLRTVLAEQVAGGSAPPAALGHPLPFPVRSTADANRLAQEALEALRAALGARLDLLLDPLGAPGWSAATRWLGTVETECHRWGLDLQPFPGLT
jgi:hypothetical protein